MLDSSHATFRFEELIATKRAVSRVLETWLDDKRRSGACLVSA
jgi:hypothetical protein